MILLQILAFILGAALVLRTLASAVNTFVLPRSARDFLTSIVFLTSRRLFDLRTRRARSYEERDRIMALYAPVSLLLLPLVWLALVLVGYMLIFWALGVENWGSAFRLSGSSMLTLGFSAVDDVAKSAAAFSEAGIGLVLIALLIAYLPTMYAGFSRREAAVNMLEVRAGSPPSAVEMISRFNRIHGLEQLSVQWSTWEMWFVDLDETHTSLAAMAFFRSPRPEHSWITAAGAVLDAASLARSTLDIPADPRADLCIRAGYLALRHIADFFRIEYNPAPQKGDPISISRAEYDAVCARFESEGIPLKADRDAAWLDFAGWRINYDTVLLSLARLTAAPYAPWSSDRSLMRHGRKKRGGR